MRISPITFKDACSYIRINHRHHQPPVGHKFSISCVDNKDKIIGVAICGRPVARHCDNGYTLEVTRLCTEGHKNTCSMLYAACRRIAKEMGYKLIITYILESETGVSLKAAGWTCIGKAGGLSWNCKGRPREDKTHPTLFDPEGIIKSPKEFKIKWVAVL